MNGKERLTAAMEYKPVDRTPTALLDGVVWMIEQEKLSFEDMFAMPDGGAEILMKYYDKAHSDMVWVAGGSYAVNLRALGAHAKFDIVGGAGETAPFATTIEDFKKLDASTIREQLLSDPGVQSLIRMAKAYKDKIGGQKFITSLVGAPFSVAGMIAGVQNLMVLLYDEDPEDLQPLFDYSVRVCVETTRLFVEAGCDMAMLGDPVASGDLISPELYEEFALPLLKKATAEIRQIPGLEKILLHICGNTAARVPVIGAAGIDMFSCDSIDIAEAIKNAGGKFAIFGNMSPANVMRGKTPEEIKAITAANIAAAGGTGYIAAPGCDLAIQTPIENINAMYEAAIA